MRTAHSKPVESIDRGVSFSGPGAEGWEVVEEEPKPCAVPM